MLPLKNRDILSIREIKKVGFSVVIGLILATIVSLIFGYEKREIGLFACVLGVAVAYFIIGNLIFKD